MVVGAVSAQVVVRRSERFVLDAAIEIDAGEIVAIMGPSGAGKSTLLGVLAGTVAPTAGQVSVGGSDARGADARRAAGGVVMLGQRPLLFPHLSVRENVAFGLRARRMPRRTALAEADDWLARIGLEGFGERLPADLSGGQQQRVALARALAIRPALLLLDEPLTSLDPVTAADVRTVLREQLADTGTTTVIVTHDAFDAAALATRMVVIEHGSITQQGPVQEVLENPATRFVAASAGLNRVRGVAAQGAWVSGDAAAVRLASAMPTSAPDGAALVAVFRPADVRLTVGAPLAGGWSTRIERLEPVQGGARVHVTDPELAVDVSSVMLARLALAPGACVSLTIDPADVRLLPESSAAARGPAQGILES